MHEGEEAQQPVVVSIEVTVLERLVSGVPESVDKLLALIVAAEHRGRGGGGNEADAVAQFAETASLQDLIALGQGAVSTVLVDEGHSPSAQLHS